jgi:hypothetical protein
MMIEPGQAKGGSGVEIIPQPGVAPFPGMPVTGP